jgi:hypothetical protein
MSTLKEMLKLSGGSFEIAEQMGLNYISNGNSSVWLDMAILYFSQGKRDLWRKALNEYEKIYPDCLRLSYNNGWKEMHDGNFKGLEQFVEAGRAIGAFGNWKIPQMKCPRWDGKTDLTNKSIVLWGEGGQGDQVIGLRAASWLSKLGATVTAAVSEPLLTLARRVPGISASVERESSHLIGCDFYIQAMSAPYVCDKTWETLWPGKYINAPSENIQLWDRIIPSKSGELNVAFRWRGNPAYEEDVLRWFPPELMLELSNIPNINFYSIQKDDPQCLPTNVTDLEPLLSSWDCTTQVISRMDLVISACTSVAHVSAAMNIPTWVMVPVAHYYPWARPGEETQWYPSVRLFKQEKYGEWKKPFSNVRTKLNELIKNI